jgi:hypothetical protein
MIKISEFIALENTEFSRPGWPALTSVLLFLTVLFLFQPVIAIVALTVYCLLLERSSLLLLFVLAAMLSMYLGLLNLVKLPESDMGVYLKWLALAREQGLIEFMAISPKEPGYCLYMYLLANVPWSDDGLFIFVSTILPYGIILTGLVRLGSRLNLPAHAIVGALILIAFFPALFNNSAHLMRQFLAGAFIAWFYVDDTLGSKSRWWILLLAISFHTTALVFLPLAVAGSIRKYSPGILLTIALLVLSSVFILLKFAAPFMTSIPYLGSIFQRAISGVYIDHAPLGMAPLLLLCFVFIFALYKLYIGVRSRELVSKEVAYNLYIATFFLSLFVWWAHFTGETMLATRFLLYVYFLTGPIVLLVFVEAPNKKIFSTIALITIPVYFVYTIVNGVWTYGGDGIWTSFALLIYEIWS